MRILIALHDYLPLHAGGSEVHAHQSGAELARRGHAVTALFTERDRSIAEGTIRRGELDGFYRQPEQTRRDPDGQPDGTTDNCRVRTRLVAVGDSWR